MAYPVQADQSGNEGTGTSGVATLPAHASGDLLIAHWSVDGQYTGPTLTGTGWAMIANQNVSSGTSSMTFYTAFKVAASSAETSPTLTWGTSEDWVAFTETVTGHDVSVVGDMVWSTGTSTTSSGSFGAISTLNASTEYLIIGTIGGSTGSAGGGTANAPWTNKRFDYYHGTTVTAQYIIQAEMTWTGGTTPGMAVLNLPSAMRNYKLALAIPGASGGSTNVEKLAVGSTLLAASKMYVGTAVVSKAYVGTVQVYGAA